MRSIQTKLQWSTRTATATATKTSGDRCHSRLARPRYIRSHWYRSLFADYYFLWWLDAIIRLIKLHNTLAGQCRDIRWHCKWRICFIPHRLCAGATMTSPLDTKIKFIYQSKISIEFHRIVHIQMNPTCQGRFPCAKSSLGLFIIHKSSHSLPCLPHKSISISLEVTRHRDPFRF